MPESITAEAPVAAGEIEAAMARADAAPVAETGTRWLPYCLGLSLQTFLWFLLFLAIIVAVLVGGELTEFRYVGF